MAGREKVARGGGGTVCCQKLEFLENNAKLRRKTEIAHFIEIRAIIKAFSLVVVALVVIAVAVGVVVAVAVVLAFRAFFTCYKLPQHSLE